MKFNSQAEVVKALGISKIVDITKVGFRDLASIVRDIDPAIALGVVAEIPRFAELARGVVSDLARTFEAATTAEVDAQAQLFALFRVEQEILREELARDLSPEQRIDVLDRIREIRNLATDVYDKGGQARKELGGQWIEGATKVVTVLAGIVVMVLLGSRGGMRR